MLLTSLTTYVNNIKNRIAYANPVFYCKYVNMLNLCKLKFYFRIADSYSVFSILITLPVVFTYFVVIDKLPPTDSSIFSPTK